MEKTAVAVRTLNPGNFSDNPASYCDGIQDAEPLTGATMWLLSTKEADLVGQQFREADYAWWLRSPGYDQDSNWFMAFVLQSRDIIPEGIDGFNQHKMRPAFNIGLSSVIFTSAAEDGKSSGTVGATALTAPEAYTGNEWKLTVLDSDRTFSASRTDSGNVPAGSNITINYSGATVGTNEYVSAILLDSAGTDLLYYGRIVNVTSDSLASGSANITIPSGLDDGDYILKVFSEQYNDNYVTDYASNFSDISFTVGEKTPEADDPKPAPEKAQEPVRQYVDTDTCKSELGAGTITVYDFLNSSSYFDLKAHSLSARDAINQMVIARAFAAQKGKTAKELTAFGIYPGRDLTASEKGTKLTLTWRDLTVKTPGTVYAVCYHQNGGAYILEGIVDAAGTAVFPGYLLDAATNVTIFQLI